MEYTKRMNSMRGTPTHPQPPASSPPPHLAHSRHPPIPRLLRKRGEKVGYNVALVPTPPPSVEDEVHCDGRCEEGASVPPGPRWRRVQGQEIGYDESDFG